LKDRIPTPAKAGRVLITPENGGAPFYAVLSMANEPLEEGTALVKRNLLQDATAALYGKDANAVPDDILAEIGQYNKHWWSVLHGQAEAGFEEKRTPVSKDVTIKGYTDYNWTLQYSREISIDQVTGEVSLVDPAELKGSLSLAGGEALAAMGPVYIKGLYDENPSIYYIPEGAVCRESEFQAIHPKAATIVFYYDGDYYYMDFNANSNYPASVITSKVFNIPAGATTYVQSLDRSAYPDYDTADGLTYRYLGVPFMNASSAVSVETQEYAGTGSADSLVSLTFERMPQLVVVTSKETGETALLFPLFGYGIELTGGSAIFALEVEGKTIRMPNALNTVGKKYRAMAIG
jgi:hypothetical protein